MGSGICQQSTASLLILVLVRMVSLCSLSCRHLAQDLHHDVTSISRFPDFPVQSRYIYSFLIYSESAIAQA